MTPQLQTPPPHATILEILTGQLVGTVVSCVAKLGIPDLVEAGPKTADELGSQIGAHPRALYRLLRAAASVGVLAEDTDGKFSQTPLSAVLRSNAAPSMRAYAMMVDLELFTRCREQLEYSIKTGKTAAEVVYGKPIFQYFAEHPDAAGIFNGR